MARLQTRRHGDRRGWRSSRSSASVVLLSLSCALLGLVWPLASALVSAGLASPWAAPLPSRNSGSRLRHRLAASGVAELAEDKKEELRMLSISLMQRISKEDGKLEAETSGSQTSEVELHEFRAFLQKVDLDCTDEQAKQLFSMLDTERNGRVDIPSLRNKLRESSVVTDMYSEALRNVGLTLVPAVILAVGFTLWQGASAGLDFVTAYIVEDSLSVDNLFVFLVLFKKFNMPPALQSYALSLGIYGAIILRAFFIFVGLAAVKSFQPLLLVFSAFLIFASYQGLFTDEGDECSDKDDMPEVVQGVLNRLPTTSEFRGQDLVVEDKQKGWLVTPLGLCIIAVELSDVLFAVDSIPAVFAVTDDAWIVYTSNIAAILGLRSLYQVLAVAVEDLVYLEKSVAIVLGFVGVKLAAEVAGYEVGSLFSLLFIITTLGGGIVASKLK